LYYKQHNYGRRCSSVDFYKPKKRVPLQSLRPRVGSGRAKHFGAAAFEAIRNFGAGKILEGSVLSGAVAKLRVQQVSYILFSFVIFSSLHLCLCNEIWKRVKENGMI
jgi:hypothetical protein